jgi:hypothetical protein
MKVANSKMIFHDYGHIKGDEDCEHTFGKCIIL